LGGGQGENKVSQKKLRSSGEKIKKGGKEKINLQKKLKLRLIRVKKGQRKKVHLGWHINRREKPISTPSIHICALVGASSLNLGAIGHQVLYLIVLLAFNKSSYLGTKHPTKCNASCQFNVWVSFWACILFQGIFICITFPRNSHFH